MLPLHHSTPLIGHKQPSPPMSHPSATLVQSPTSLPAPSTTPPPSSTTTAPIQRNKPSFSYDNKTNLNSNAFHLPKLTREFYYMKPKLAELKSYFDDKAQCIVEQFTVGHEKYGSVTFYGPINVAGLDLDRISNHFAFFFSNRIFYLICLYFS